jgi:hypothetical protein
MHDDPLRPRSAYRISRTNAGAAWTAEDLQELANLVETGTPIPTIAQRIGRSQEAIRGQAQRAGLLRRRGRSGVESRSE